jgi:hypothetical protein
MLEHMNREGHGLKIRDTQIQHTPTQIGGGEGLPGWRGGASRGGATSGGRGTAAQPLGCGAAGWLGLAPAWPRSGRSGPFGAHLGPGGPGSAPAASGGERRRPGLGAAVLAARVLQRADGSFTNPLWFGRARWAWFAPIDASGRCSQAAVEAGPSSVSADLLSLVLGWFSLILLVPFSLPR